MKTGTEKTIIKTAASLLIFFLLVYLYTLLHEGGHALVGIIYGGRINNFVLGFDAHVAVSGANFTQIGESLFNAAGVLLPAICLAVALIFYNRNVKSIIYHYLYAICSIMITGSFFAWVAIPVISLFTTLPAGDDVSKFLNVSGLNPLLISLIAFLLMFLLVLVACKKGLYSKIKENLSALSQVRHRNLNKRQTVVVVLVFILFGSAIFVFNQTLLRNKVFETSFSMNVHDDLKDVKMSFAVDTNKTYKMNMKLDAEGMLTDIQIYDDKGNKVYQNICEWFTYDSHLSLNAGNYQFVLTFIRNPEVMAQYFEEKGYEFSQEELDGLKKLLAKKRNEEFIPVSFSAVIQ
ncbi:MAG TPA: hypothetical protein GXX36_15810 [Clostridiaceae bacterium]|nr:hypothetical protein [Clostridiaceae bacterium]